MQSILAAVQFLPTMWTDSATWSDRPCVDEPQLTWPNLWRMRLELPHPTITYEGRGWIPLGDTQQKSTSRFASWMCSSTLYNWASCVLFSYRGGCKTGLEVWAGSCVGAGHEGVCLGSKYWYVYLYPAVASTAWDELATQKWHFKEHMKWVPQNMNGKKGPWCYQCLLVKAGEGSKKPDFSHAVNYIQIVAKLTIYTKHEMLSLCTEELML